MPDNLSWWVNLDRPTFAQKRREREVAMNPTRTAVYADTDTAIYRPSHRETARPHAPPVHDGQTQSGVRMTVGVRCP
jgi:hypothetical protein